MAELLITSSLDPIEAGQSFPKGLPRHVTIWQYFQLPDSHLETFTEAVGEAIEAFSPLEIVGANQAEFGPNNDVPVRRVMALGSGATLITLHGVLSEIIKHHEGKIERPEWAYKGFNPHITYVEGRALEENEYAKLHTIELIERTAPSGDKVVRNVWELEEV